MSTLQRYLHGSLLEDLKNKMVFLGGPRQVGKTTLAQILLRESANPKERALSNASSNAVTNGYLNWDSSQDRRVILDGTWPSSQQLIVFDELHKYVKWRSLIKGYFDKRRQTHQFLVTGSARLDYYRKSGDSLLGRYHYYRLHPFTLAEVGSEQQESLLRFGGFPEPFLAQRESSLKRWHLQRRERIIYSDVRDLERINEITSLELLAEALPERVGSPLSRKNLAQELEVDFKTVERWIQILENVYYCYRLAPFGPPKIRAVKKEQKIFLWDWSEHTDPGKRWENFVASHLLKYCHHRQDTQGDRMELRFLRDVTGREIDFVVLADRKPLFAVECKTGEKSLSPHLNYFAERTTIPSFYQVHTGKKAYSFSDKIHVIHFTEFAQQVGLV